MARLRQSVYSRDGYEEVSDFMRGKDTKRLQNFQQFVLKPAIIALLAADGIGYFIARSTMNYTPPVPKEWGDRGLAVKASADVPMPAAAIPAPVARVSGSGILEGGSDDVQHFLAGTNESESDPELAVIGPVDLPEKRIASSRRILVSRISSSAKLELRTIRPTNAAFVRAFPARFNSIASAALVHDREGLGEPDTSASLPGEGLSASAVLPETGQEPASPPSAQPLTDELPALSDPMHAVTDPRSEAPTLPATTEDAIAEPFSVADAVTSQATPAGSRLPTTEVAVSSLAQAILAGEQRDQALQESSSQQPAERFAAPLVSASQSFPDQHQSAAAIDKNPGWNLVGGHDKHNGNAAPSATLANLASRGKGLSGTGHDEDLNAIAAQGKFSRGVDERGKSVDAQNAEAGHSIRLGDLLAALAPMMDIGEFGRLSASKSADAVVTLEALQNYGIPLEYDPIERTVSIQAGTKIKIVA